MRRAQGGSGEPSWGRFSHWPSGGMAMAGFTRRDVLKASSALALYPVAACVARPMPVRMPFASAIPEHESGLLVKDVNSQLHETRVHASCKTVGMANDP